MKAVILIAAALVIAGCGQPPGNKPSNEESPSGNSTADQSEVPTPPRTVEEIPADAYASVDEAIAVMKQTLADRDSKERTRVYLWLAMQGDAAVGPLAGLLKDESADVQSKLAACQALSMIGPPATTALVEATTDKEEMVRRNAVEKLGKLKPPNENIIRALVRALDDKDQQARVLAVQGLRKIGARAKDLAEQRLVAMMRSEDNQTVIDEVGKALKAINPNRAAGVFDN